jgi:hypothetical protein
MTTPHHLLAYLDPGSSGLIVQMIGGGLAAFLVAMKLYGRRVLHVLHLKRGDASETTPRVGADDHTK